MEVFRRGLVAVLVIAALAVSACGGGAQSSQPSKNQTVSVTMAQSIVTLSNAGVYVAIEKGYYKERNVNLKLTTLQSGASTAQAMASSSVDMVASGAYDVAAASAKGIPFQAFVNGTGTTTELCASKKFAESKGLTASSSLQDIMGAWKGATLGITGANGAPDLVVRYLLRKYGHLTPDQDVKIVALGTVGAEVQAVSRGQIDGFLQSPPGCEQAVATGTAVNVLRPSRVSGFSQTPLGVVYTSKKWAQDHSEAMGRVANATAKGDAYAIQHPDETIAVLQKYFPGLNVDILRDAYTNVVVPAMTKNGKMNPAGWKNVSDVLVTSGSIKKPLDAKEGNLWTNSYITEVQ
jgi:NitT/TauT family transport system substrate-binding protein